MIPANRNIRTLITTEYSLSLLYVAYLYYSRKAVHEKRALFSML